MLIIRLSEFILNNYYQVKTKYMNQSIKDEKIVHEFFELSLEQLNGDYMMTGAYYKKLGYNERLKIVDEKLKK